MKKRFTLITAALMMLTILAIPIGMRGQRSTATFAPSHFSGQGTSGSGSAISATVDGVTFACNKGYGTTQIRCYKDGKITISSSNTITGISFTFSGSYTGGLETSYTDLSTTSWEQTLSSQARITECVVTYSGGGSTYSVTYNKNGGDEVTGTVPTDDTEYSSTNNTVTVAGNTGSLAKTGHDWSGWCLNSAGTGDVYGPSYTTTYTISASTTFYAKWTAHTHDITMPNTDDYGSYEASATTDVPYGTTVTLTYTPETGYENYAATWSVNDAPIDGNTFSMPDEDVTVTVVLTPCVIWDLTTNSYASATDNLVTWSNSNATMTLAKNTSSTNANNYLGNGSDHVHTRCYKDQVLSITPASGKLISLVEITTTSNDYATNLAGYTWTNASATNSGKKVTVTPVNSGIACSVQFGAACYLTNVKVVYSDLVEHTITFNGNGGTSGSDLTYTQTVYDNVPTALTANSFTRANFGFTNWNTAADGSGTDYDDQQSVTITADLTLYAQWTALRTATVYSPISNGSVKIDDGADGVSSVSVIPGTEITLIATPASGYKFKAWNVYKSGEPETKVTVTSDKFDMPDYNVIIDAEFHDKYTITFSVNGNTSVVAPILVTIEDNVDLSGVTASLAGFDFAGWSETEGGAAVSNPYTPADNVTLYALFTKTGTMFLVINKDTENFPTSYGDANTFTEYTLVGKKFKIQQAFVTSGASAKLQWRSGVDANGAGTMYNSEDLGIITSVVLVYDASDSNKNFTINAGTTENPTSGTSITPSISENTYTFDLSGGNYHYFVMTNGQYAGYLTSITINYSGTSSVIFTNITTNVNRSTPILANELVTVQNGGVLNLTSANSGDENNLIIEDGGQLVHNGGDVDATIQKNISAWSTSAKGGSGWYLVASPVDNVTIATSTLVSGDPDDYDLYGYHEPTHHWLNYKNGDQYSIFDGLKFKRGKGYLYANEAEVVISFAGSMKETDVNVEVPLSWASSEESVKGWNLVGNPYSCNAYVNLAYYAMNAAGNNFDSKATSVAIPPFTGIFVRATGESQNVTFSTTPPSSSANNGHLQIVLNETSTRGGIRQDNAIVSFNKGEELTKFVFNEENAEVYFTKSNEDYAVAYSEKQGQMLLNFKAKHDGTYTLSFEVENTEMNYLHFIDKLTGNDIDLLATPEYTFSAKSGDSENRFRLVFEANGNALVTSNEPFAYFNGSEWVIENDGNATLQVIDVMGRMLRSENVSGNATTSLPNLSAGVYVLRLVNNESIRTQKVVIE